MSDRSPTTKSVFGNGQIIPTEVREPVVLPQQFPVCLHNPTPSSGTGRLRIDLDLNYRSPAKRVKDFLRKLLRFDSARH